MGHYSGPCIRWLGLWGVCNQGLSRTLIEGHGLALVYTDSTTTFTAWNVWMWHELQDLGFRV